MRAQELQETKNGQTVVVWMHDQYNEQPLTSSMNIAPKKASPLALHFPYLIQDIKNLFSSSCSAPCWRQKQTKSIKRVSKCGREREKKLMRKN